MSQTAKNNSAFAGLWNRFQTNVGQILDLTPAIVANETGLLDALRGETFRGVASTGVSQAAVSQQKQQFNSVVVPAILIGGLVLVGVFIARR